MSADAFNAKELEAGRVTPAHLTELTLAFQRESHRLREDGCFGQATRDEIHARRLDLTTAAGLRAAYPNASALGCSAVEIALALRGRGEEGANNSGPFIAELGGHDGDLWCALFAGHAWREAHRLAGKAPPAWAFRRPGVAEPGAKALANVAARESQRLGFHDPALVLPGDLVLWKRAGGHHVGLVWHPLPGGIVATVEGNVGAFPARVRDLTHDAHHEPHFVAFARPPQL